MDTRDHQTTDNYDRHSTILLLSLKCTFYSRVLCATAFFQSRPKYSAVRDAQNPQQKHGSTQTRYDRCLWMLYKCIFLFRICVQPLRIRAAGQMRTSWETRELSSTLVQVLN